MKYGVYRKAGKIVETRMIAKVEDHDNIINDGWVFVAFTKTKKEAKEIFDNLEGHFWN